MNKNESYHGVVAYLGSEGEGVINLTEGRAFVPGCISGEEVSFTALKVRGDVAYGKLNEVITPSPDRVTPPCPVFLKCGGCQLQHMSYPAQLKFKGQLVQNCLKKLGNLDVEVNQTVSGGSQYGYRNKLALPVGVDGSGNNIVGVYAPRSHRIVPVNNCALQREWCALLIDSLLKYMNACGVKGYDEETKKGVVRHIVGRQVGQNFIFTVVAAEKIDLSPLAEILDKNFPSYTLWLNVNGGTGNAIFGKEWHICRGQGTFMGEDCGIKFTAGANTFLQVNDDVRSLLYRAVQAEVCSPNAVAIDLYSGGGMLTAMLAGGCSAAYGIEIVPEAVRCADELARLNGLSHKMKNLCGAVEDKIGEVLAQTRGKQRVIVCDPPRKGMERSVVREIANSGAEKVVLISCNPATLARDLGLLCGSLVEDGAQIIKNPAYIPRSTGPYIITSVTPFDMFPQTKHVETLVLLSKKSDSHINVDIEFGEGEGQISLKEVEERAEARKPKAKVTYKMIQQYIEEHYGFKVHTAYIAEVKRDLGLPMYDAPNAVEELKRPRAHPSEKMVAAIKETLAHFEII